MMKPAPLFGFFISINPPGPLCILNFLSGLRPATEKLKMKIFIPPPRPLRIPPPCPHTASFARIPPPPGGGKNSPSGAAFLHAVRAAPPPALRAGGGYPPPRLFPPPLPPPHCQLLAVVGVGRGGGGCAAGSSKKCFFYNIKKLRVDAAPLKHALLLLSFEER
nr:hypothetical protein [Morchella crassipes]